jgi:transcriptional regulator with XRE-family HTH domain
MQSLRHRRQLLQLPATYFATRIGVTITTFNRFERGERRTYTDQALTIARLLGCSIEDLGRPVTPEEEIELFRRGVERKRGGTVVDAPGQQHQPMPTPTLTDDEIAARRMIAEDPFWHQGGGGSAVAMEDNGDDD